MEPKLSPQDIDQVAWWPARLFGGKEFRHLYRVQKFRISVRVDWARDLARTLQYSIFAYVIAGAALNMAYFDYMYMVFAILVALRELVSCPKDPGSVKAGSSI